METTNILTSLFLMIFSKIQDTLMYSVELWSLADVHRQPAGAFTATRWWLSLRMAYQGCWALVALIQTGRGTFPRASQTLAEAPRPRNFSMMYLHSRQEWPKWPIMAMHLLLFAQQKLCGQIGNSQFKPFFWWTVSAHVPGKILLLKFLKGFGCVSIIDLTIGWRVLIFPSPC